MSDELIPIAAKMSSTFTWNGKQHGTRLRAENCIDGDTVVSFCNTGGREEAPWLVLEFNALVHVRRVVIYNRNISGNRLKNLEVRVTNELPVSSSYMSTLGQLLGRFPGPGRNGQIVSLNWSGPQDDLHGRYVIVQMRNYQPLHLHEVKVFGFSSSPHTKNCCEAIQISSTGGAAGDHGSRLGSYTKDGTHNHKPIYWQNGGNNLIYYRGTPHFRWAFGPRLNLETLRSFHNPVPNCPYNVTEWEYISQTRWLVDNTIKGTCVDYTPILGKKYFLSR